MSTDSDWQETAYLTPPELWRKLKSLARQHRHEPTPAENVLWEHLRSRRLAGKKFRRQHTVERFIVDFYCAEARLVIEVDGAIHDYTPEEDAIRQEFLESRGLRVIRFRNEQVLGDIEEVLATIQQALAGTANSDQQTSTEGQVPSPEAGEGI